MEIKKFIQNHDFVNRCLKKDCMMPNYPGFLFIFGEKLDLCFENTFSEGATLLDFGDLQIIVSLTDDGDYSFQQLVVNSKELLLERWNKVALLGGRWTAYDSFLRDLHWSGVRKRDIASILEILTTESNMIVALSEIIKQCNYLPQLSSPKNWMLFFDGCIKDLYTWQKLIHSDYCTMLADIYSIFSKFAFHLRPNFTFANTSLGFDDQLHQMIGNYYFAKSILYQLQKTFSEKKNWTLFLNNFEINSYVVKKLDSFLWKNEQHKSQLENCLTCLQLPKYYYASKSIAESLERLINQQESDIPELSNLPQCLKGIVKSGDAFCKTQDIFEAVSYSLSKNKTFLADILRVLCLAEIIRNAKHFQRKKGEIYYFFLIRLVLSKRSENVDSSLFDAFAFREDDFNDTIFEIITWLIRKSLIIYSKKDDKFKKNICLLEKTLPFAKLNCKCYKELENDMETSDNEEDWESADSDEETVEKLSLINLSPIGKCNHDNEDFNNSANSKNLCDLYYDVDTSEFSFITLVQEGMFWIALPPNWHLSCLDCGSFQNIAEKDHSCFASWFLYSRPCFNAQGKYGFLDLFKMDPELKKSDKKVITKMKPLKTKAHNSYIKSDPSLKVIEKIFRSFRSFLNEL